MKRRNFIGLLGGSSAGAAISAALPFHVGEAGPGITRGENTLNADIVIAGGGLGGVAAALASLRNGQSVIVTETTDWLGGQLTAQGVPPDEHPWIETHGAPQSYRDLRNRIRDYYRQHYPLTGKEKANAQLNPGNGAVSRLCHEPAVAEAVIRQLLMPYISSGRLLLLTEHQVVRAAVRDTRVESLTVRNKKNGALLVLKSAFFIDATELGDLLPLTGTSYVTGTESRRQTGELHAPETADPGNNQAFTMCFAVDYIEGERHTISRPADYLFWKNYIPALKPAWPGKLLSLRYAQPQTLQAKDLGFSPDGKATGELLNLWNYRRIIDRKNFKEGFYKGDITIVNWPQNDYIPGNIVDVAEGTFQKHVDRAKQLSLSLLYWLQTEAPGPGGGRGWPGLRLRRDIMGTADGLAKYPYIRESRRIKAQFTILEEHVGRENRARVATAGKEKAASFFDSVGIGYYHIDLHPSSRGNNYIDFPSLPFQIPLGALLPVKMENIFPANKNIGTTHITNGCYRLHPVEWSIGEAVGLLLVFAKAQGVLPAAVRRDRELLKKFQAFIQTQGVETEWPAL
ncbi:FAD-dependent oxidoreductase [Niabella drilacis]|uniref:FAD dependent oxidoreductase n=1 Tax=Niabella drilacis (strain DSM 25811 / CCM 8410 / CCUG 62505 / LMG 26954 / E90) TaxID=1285928 RepID=A0A1G6YC82_NIADE|nr:FAD-dependent oxidoreductase [Niabella drilacis]SDD87347.1 FAD dependent oxidoreductase [Niabella drilacis]